MSDKLLFGTVANLKLSHNYEWDDLDFQFMFRFKYFLLPVVQVTVLTE